MFQQNNVVMNILVLGILTVVLLFGGYLHFKKRDIP
jgi:ABC-type transport system involved in multi-copper enzyme maturation permease subunit